MDSNPHRLIFCKRHKIPLQLSWARANGCILRPELWAFRSIGFKTRILLAPEATELAKLTGPTYFGPMIASAQEVERYWDRAGKDHEGIISFSDNSPLFPGPKYFTGISGGDCAISHIQIMRTLDDLLILTAIQTSSRKKIEREAGKELSDHIIYGQTDGSWVKELKPMRRPQMYASRSRSAD